MAQAEIKLREIVPIVPLTEDYVELQLTLPEARVLLQLIGSTCGNCPQVATVFHVLAKLDLPAPEHKLVIASGRVGLWAPNTGDAS